MAADLVFSRPRLTGSPTHLVFGDDDGPPVIAPVTAVIRATLADTLFVSAVAALPVRAAAVAILSDDVVVTAVAGYDNRVTRWLGQSVAAPHQRAVADLAERDGAWRVSLPKRDTTALGWQTARQAAAALAMPLNTAAPRHQGMDAPWQLADPRHQQATAAHQQAVLHDARRSTGWQLANRRSVRATAPMQAGIFRDSRRAAPWRTAVFQSLGMASRLGASQRLSGVQFMALPWQLAMHARNGRSVLPVRPKPPKYPRDGNLVFQCPRLVGFPLDLVFGGCGSDLPAARVVIPFLRAYVTINSIILRRVDGDMPIPIYGFSMSLDWQSWTWSWSASIALASLPLITPGSDRQPVEVEAVVNGVPYRLCAEGFGSQRGFAKGRVGVKGRGLAAVLDEPYAPVLNFASASDRTAQQLMLDALTVNGVSLGWDVDFGLTDWLVPGNTWAHQGEYISAVTAIAQAAGGYVQPHDTDKTLRILPGYPVAPWDWGDVTSPKVPVTPDFELPSAVVTLEGIDWTRKPDYNRVFVSGMGGGVLGQVTRTGTAGDIVAPMVTDALITHADAARQRGLSVLADTGMQARVNLTLPVLAETGLIKPGNFVRYTDAGTARMGLVRSAALSWSFPKMRQTLAVETHV